MCCTLPEKATTMSCKHKTRSHPDVVLSPLASGGSSGGYPRTHLPKELANHLGVVYWWVQHAHSVLADPGDVQWLVTRAAKDDRSASPVGALLFKHKPAALPEQAHAYRASSESSKLLLLVLL